MKALRAGNFELREYTGPGLLLLGLTLMAGWWQSTRFPENLTLLGKGFAAETYYSWVGFFGHAYAILAPILICADRRRSGFQSLVGSYPAGRITRFLSATLGATCFLALALGGALGLGAWIGPGLNSLPEARPPLEYQGKQVLSRPGDQAVIYWASFGGAPRMELSPRMGLDLTGGNQQVPVLKVALLGGNPPVQEIDLEIHEGKPVVFPLGGSTADRIQATLTLQSTSIPLRLAVNDCLLVGDPAPRLLPFMRHWLGPLLGWSLVLGVGFWAGLRFHPLTALLLTLAFSLFSHAPESVRSTLGPLGMLWNLLPPLGSLQPASRDFIYFLGAGPLLQPATIVLLWWGGLVLASQLSKEDPRWD